MKRRYPLVAERAAHRCEYCGAPEAVFNVPFEVEHLIPPNRGGRDAEFNWALACRSCNLHKSDHVEAADPESSATVLLFNPRQDVWREHFRIDKASGTIIGATPTGRATVGCLQINAPRQLAARRQWMRLKLFPPEYAEA